jgi:hypothetical protein
MLLVSGKKLVACARHQILSDADDKQPYQRQIEATDRQIN